MKNNGKYQKIYRENGKSNIRMKLTKLIRSGVKNLLINKMRTGLAILGIVIGIGSVIALMSMGEASKASVQSSIQSLGANLLTVSPMGQRTGMVRGAAGGGTTLTLDDATAIATSREITTIQSISPVYSGRSQVTAGRNNTNTQVMGVTSSYQIVRKVTMASGKFISDTDNSSVARVAVLGPTTAEDLFGEGVNPVGQTIKINGQTMQVIGVTTSKGGSGPNNADDALYIPLATAQKRIFGVKYLSTLYLEAKSQEVMTKAQDEVGYFLMDRHGITDSAKIDFRIMSQADILETVTSVAGTFTSLLTGVAAISLLVGGIGIMNIMLMSVTERTREIGLRKALGAKKKTIIEQFLVESVILTFTGGILGILVGLIGFFVYAKVAGAVFIVSPVSILLAFGVSAAIGVLFGWYPAKIASDLQPIEALRYE